MTPLCFMHWRQHKIDTRGHRFEHILQDIETLNQRALRGELHISAVSIHAYAYLADKYALLPCGASMGDGYGPMLVTLGEFPSNRKRDERMASLDNSGSTRAENQRIPGPALVRRSRTDHHDSIR